MVVVMTGCRESLGSHESFQRPREGCFIFEQKVGCRARRRAKWLSWFKGSGSEVCSGSVLGCQGQCTSKSQGRGGLKGSRDGGELLLLLSSVVLLHGCTAGEIVAGSSATHRMSSPSSSRWVARMRPRLVSDKPVPHPEGL